MMEPCLERLKSWGCDTASAMTRLMNDEPFYLDCLRELTEEPTFAALGAAMARGDMHAAYMAAYTLKGTLANLSVAPMLQTILPLADGLRTGHTDALEGPYRRLLAQRDELTAILRENP